jgi:hypothetical protein
VQISGTFQNLPGAVVQSNANYGLFGTAGAGPFVPFKAFQIVEPGALYVERLNQIDFRVSKILRFGTTRTASNFDFYNVTELQLGSQRERAYSAPNVNPGWRSPTSILLPRLFKFSAQFDF